MERRRYPRIPVELHAEIEIDLDFDETQEKHRAQSKICGMVNTIDIALGGFCVKILNSQTDTDKCFIPAKAYSLVGKVIKAFFKDYGLAISGKVVRLEPKTMLMAVVITRVSDIKCWRDLCEMAISREDFVK